MPWAETIVQALKDWDTSLIAYVPDVSIHQVTSLIDEDPFFHLVSATREEEAIGIAVGSYAVGRNAAVFMQSSGFGNSVNALASLCVPCKDAHPHLHKSERRPRRVQHRPGAMGRTTRPILDLLGLVHFTLESEDRMDRLVDGAMKLCHANRQPVAICLTQMLHGGKLA